MVLGVIPARGGSKGLPRKNILPIAGFPLIYWSIQAAKRSKLLDDYVVSTDDQEIAAIAHSYGARVIDRPAHLGQDDTTTLAVLQHVISSQACDAVAVLQPTSPLRNADTIDNCIREFQNGDYDTLATGYYTKIIEYGTHQNLRRQDIPGFFYDDGNVYIISKSVFAFWTSIFYFVSGQSDCFYNRVCLLFLFVHSIKKLVVFIPASWRRFLFYGFLVF